MGGGGGVIFFLHFMLFPTFLEQNNSGNKKQNISLFRITIVDRDSGNLYPIYIKKIVVLASEPVGGRSRVTELPCYVLVISFVNLLFMAFCVIA